MKVVGLVKTFGGTEFVEAAIESVYDFCDKIVFVHSTRDWLGEEGEGNTVKPVVEAWANAHDTDNKIINLTGDWPAQATQYDIGYRFIKEHLECDWVMCFDTDEVWDYSNLETARQTLEKAVQYNAVGAWMHTYIKSPFYRVTPPEILKPTVFSRPLFDTLIGIRGNGMMPRVVPDNLFFHHFTYVRYREADVMRKIQTTLLGDQEDVPSCTLIDLEKWKRDKWDRLPKARDFHTTKKFEKSWHACVKVRLSDLPPTVRNKRIIKEHNQ